MPARPVNRRARETRADRAAVRGGTAALAKLFDLGPFDRNQLDRHNIDRLRTLIDEVGTEVAAERVGVSEVTLLRVCAGFGHRLRANTAAVIRKFLHIR